MSKISRIYFSPSSRRASVICLFLSICFLGCDQHNPGNGDNAKGSHDSTDVSSASGTGHHVNPIPVNPQFIPINIYSIKVGNGAGAVPSTVLTANANMCIIDGNNGAMNTLVLCQAAVTGGTAVTVTNNTAITFETTTASGLCPNQCDISDLLTNVNLSNPAAMNAIINDINTFHTNNANMLNVYQLNQNIMSNILAKPNITTILISAFVDAGNNFTLVYEGFAGMRFSSAMVDDNANTFTSTAVTLGGQTASRPAPPKGY